MHRLAVRLHLFSNIDIPHGIFTPIFPSIGRIRGAIFSVQPSVSFEKENPLKSVCVVSPKILSWRFCFFTVKAELVPTLFLLSNCQLFVHNRFYIYYFSFQHCPIFAQILSVYFLNKISLHIGVRSLQFGN